MWHCEGDPVVDVLNTVKYSARLAELKVSQETHIFPYGRHGMGLATEERFSDCTYMQSWAGMVADWFRLHGFIK